MLDNRPTGRREPAAVTLEIFRHLFTALTEEMGAALRRASFSPNIKERRDYSCAFFSARGAPIALGDHMPVHLGAMPMSVESALSELGPLDTGDVVCLNDPFRGGTHLPDITLISPVHDPGPRHTTWLCGVEGPSLGCRGDEPGINATRPGDLSGGSPHPPVYLHRGGVRQEGVWSLILANVRTPIERSGDLDAQLAALHAGASRLLEIVKRRGAQATMAAMDALVAYADRLVEAGLAHIEPGEYEAEDFMDDDGFGTVDIPIRVRLVRHRDGLDVDFTGSSPQVKGGINAVRAITDSATRYTVRCVVEALLGESLPAGGGSMSTVRLILPENSVVNAGPPASVAAGNVETSQRITDVLFRAFARALPDLIPALSQGTMNNTTVGGVDPRNGANFAYYETVGGGWVQVRPGTDFPVFTPICRTL